MNKLTFTSVYGDELRTVVIDRANPNVHTCTIFEDNFYIGSVVLYYGTTWTVVCQYEESFDKSPKELEKEAKFGKWSFGMDDMQAILDRMIEAGMIPAQSKI